MLKEMSIFLKAVIIQFILNNFRMLSDLIVERIKNCITFALKNTSLGRLNKKFDENFFLSLNSSNFAARILKSQAN
jgi:hypothetical protein